MSRNLAIKQFVYNYPAIENTQLPNGKEYNPFEDDIAKLLNGTIVSLGVQAPQGAKLLINNELIVVGPTGVFELENVIDIKSFLLQENDFLKKVIIDVLYDKGDE